MDKEAYLSALMIATVTMRRLSKAARNVTSPREQRPGEGSTSLFSKHCRSVSGHGLSISDSSGA
jgi:hypothetical protein